MTDKQFDAFNDWVAALGSMKNAAMKSTNPFFKSKYADLPSVREATVDTLNEYNLGITQPIKVIDGDLGIETNVVHVTGVTVESSFYPISRDGKPQDRGSEITYGRRYSWAAICGIAADEDDDGNAAQETTTSRPKTTVNKDLKACVHKMTQTVNEQGFKAFLKQPDNVALYKEIKAEHPDMFEYFEAEKEAHKKRLANAEVETVDVENVIDQYVRDIRESTSEANIAELRTRGLKDIANAGGDIYLAQYLEEEADKRLADLAANK